MLEQEPKRTLRRLEEKGFRFFLNENKLVVYREEINSIADLQKDPDYKHLMEMINNKSFKTENE